MWQHPASESKLTLYSWRYITAFYSIKQLFSTLCIAVRSFFWYSKTAVQNERARKSDWSWFPQIVCWCVCGCLTEWDRFLNSFQLSGTQTVLMLITTRPAAHAAAHALLSTHFPWGVCLRYMCALCVSANKFFLMHNVCMLRCAY